MCCLKAAQMNGLSFRAAKELVKPLASFLPNGENILFLAILSSSLAHRFIIPRLTNDTQLGSNSGDVSQH